jgi:sigma-B regulation protein RsbU (phosphoserine phosphatase)
VRYASAGQGPILFYERGANHFEELPATSLPLGVLEDADYSEQIERTLAPGDILAVVTDGFFESPDPAGKLFGMERVRRVVRDCRDLPAAEIIRCLHRAVVQFTGPAPQADDLTAIVAKRLPNG